MIRATNTCLGWNSVLRTRFVPERMFDKSLRKQMGLPA
jgi:hypothetical protein